MDANRKVIKKGGGTLKELTAIWRQLDGRGKLNVMAVAKGEMEYLKKYPEARRDSTSQIETAGHREEVLNTVERTG